MLKTVALIALTLVVAIGGGAASLLYALKAQEGVGAVTIGGWTAYPDDGTPAADPYSRARLAREGTLALGRTEGLAFVKQYDSNGDPLQRDCAYSIEGVVPAARFWTLYAADPAGAAIPSGSPRASGLQSFEMLRLADNSLSITVGARPAPGNWLQLSGIGAMRLVLTLYDTPAASSTAISDAELPQVLKVGCNA